MGQLRRVDHRCPRPQQREHRSHLKPIESESLNKSAPPTARIILSLGCLVDPDIFMFSRRWRPSDSERTNATRRANPPQLRQQGRQTRGDTPLKPFNRGLRAGQPRSENTKPLVNTGCAASEALIKSDVQTSNRTSPWIQRFPASPGSIRGGIRGILAWIFGSSAWARGSSGFDHHFRDVRAV